MSFASKHNKKRIFDIETEGLDYVSMEDAFNAYGKNATYRIDALYINTKGKFDDAPVAVVTIDNNRVMLNMPSHMTDEVNAIIADEEDIDTIKAGKAGLKIRPYHQKTYNKDCFGCEFVDLI